jgi:hypothetical protein
VLFHPVIGCGVHSVFRNFFVGMVLGELLAASL